MYFLTSILGILLLLNTIHAHAKQSIQNANSDRTICICIPKCGTHLLLKCITLLGIKGMKHDYTQSPKVSLAKIKYIRKNNTQLPPHHYKGIFDLPSVGPLPNKKIKHMLRARKQRLFWTHWPYTPAFEDFLSKHTRANFILVRDPRDMVVSFAHMVHKSDDGRTADMNKVIIDLITGKQEYYIPWAVEHQETYPPLWENGLYQFYGMYMPWIKTKNFMLIKFEDLIGADGGGTSEQQRQTIKNIGTHLSIALSDEKIDEVKKNLFGGTSTFREGKSGGWKKHFTPEIKKEFKAQPGLMMLLKELGYEKDDNW